MRTTQQQSPTTTFNFQYRQMLSKTNRQAGEDYRNSFYKIKENVMVETVEKKEQVETNEETTEQVVDKPVEKQLSKEEIVQALKDKGVKWVHFIKSDEKLIEKAKENEII